MVHPKDRYSIIYTATATWAYGWNTAIAHLFADEGPICANVIKHVELVLMQPRQCVWYGSFVSVSLSDSYVL